MFKLTSSPHSHSGALTAKIMGWVILALIPALVAMVYYFGYGVLIQVCLALSVTFILELSISRCRQKPLFFYVKDLSGSLTALILAIAIPPYAPFWVILIGVIMAIVVAKHIYGGLGQNVFNPAMVGYVVLLVSFPVVMTSWLPPLTLLSEPFSFLQAWQWIFHPHRLPADHLQSILANIDGLTQATPLDSLRTARTHGGEILSVLYSSPIFFSLGENLTFAIGWMPINLCFLLGGLFLMAKRIISWQIPIALLLVFALLCGITSLFSPIAPHPLWQLFSGATMFGAFFIATDPVTAPLSSQGKWLFGGLIGFLLYLIRYYGGYPDGVAFAVLLANIGVPLIDQYTRPLPIGQRGNK